MNSVICGFNFFTVLLSYRKGQKKFLDFLNKLFGIYNNYEDMIYLNSTSETWQYIKI